MLLEFYVVNYKSFKEKMVFSLVPAPKQKGLDYSIQKERAGNRDCRSLCSAVIYGPNASGKTNIIGAMDTFKAIVLRGHIRNCDEKNTPNTAASTLELIPNNSYQAPTPVEFGIRFVTDGILVEYAFAADLGVFLDGDYARRIVWEKFSVNGTPIFTRQDGLVIHQVEPIRAFLTDALQQNMEGAVALATGSLNDEELFLMNGFKAIFSSKLVEIIRKWWDEKLVVIYRADSIQVTRRYNNPKAKSVYVEDMMNDVARTFGINSNAIGYVVESEGSEPKLCSLFKGKEKSTAIPAEIFESYGTIRFINMFPLVLNVLLNGGTLVVDEFDASIHPMALMNIINIFHNDEINVHHAQLVFNTHNPIFLNGNLFRRDEIKFVERDEFTHESSQYSLADFGTSGKNGVRKNEDYMKNYFVDRYGAIKDIDFVPVLEKLMQTENEE